MEKHFYHMDGYDLHIFKTDKFKKTTVAINSINSLEPSTIAKSEILTNYMIEGTKKYPTKRLINKAKMKLYNLYIARDRKKLGDMLSTSLLFSFVDEKYTKENSFYESMDFIKEVVFNPLFTNRKPDRKTFLKVKEKVSENLKKENENKAKKALNKALNNTEEKFISYNLKNQNQIKEIKMDDLYDAYKKFLNEDKKDIYIVGDVDISKTKNYFERNFKFKSICSRFKNEYEHKNFKEKPKYDRRKENATQSHLFLVYKFKNLSFFEKHYVLDIFSDILGGGMHSKLFKEVREKHSLCYSVSSAPSKNYNTLIIGAGIDKGKYINTKRYILNTVEKMKKNITDEELSNSKQKFILNYKSREDNPFSIIFSDYNDRFYGLEKPKEQVEKYEKITKNDLFNLTDKIILDNVFLLRGEKSEIE